MLRKSRCCLPGGRLFCCSLAFFFPRDGAFDTAGVDTDTQFLADHIGQISGPDRPAFVLISSDKIQQVLVQLVRALRSTLARHQACEPTFVEGRFGLIESGPRYAKQRGRIGFAGTLCMYQPKHLVLDLDPVARVEEGIERKPRRENPLRLPVEDAEYPESFCFWIVFCQF